MTQHSSIPEPPFDRAEAARRLGVRESWLRQHRDEVPFRRVGRFVRYTQADLDTYLERTSIDVHPLAPSARSRSGRPTR
jgi:hypothetical protein